MTDIERALALAKAQRILDIEEDIEREKEQAACTRKKDDTLAPRFHHTTHHNTFGGQW